MHNWIRTAVIALLVSLIHGKNALCAAYASPSYLLNHLRFHLVHLFLNRPHDELDDPLSSSSVGLRPVTKYLV